MANITALRLETSVDFGHALEVLQALQDDAIHNREGSERNVLREIESAMDYVRVRIEQVRPLERDFSHHLMLLRQSEGAD